VDSSSEYRPLGKLRESCCFELLLATVLSVHGSLGFWPMPGLAQALRPSIWRVCPPSLSRPVEGGASARNPAAPRSPACLGRSRAEIRLEEPESAAATRKPDLK